MPYRDEHRTYDLPDDLAFDRVTITVYTPDVKDGGTDSNVYLSIGGTRFELDKEDRNDFERGQRDLFVHNLPGTLGELRGAEIILDCPGRGWFCGTVAIGVMRRGTSIARAYREFAVYDWLEDERTNRVLQRGTEYRRDGR